MNLSRQLPDEIIVRIPSDPFFLPILLCFYADKSTYFASPHTHFAPTLCIQ